MLMLEVGKDGKNRCFGSGSVLYANYHDTQWGVPVYEDKLLFEMLVLEGVQAGLSWETVLRKREGYRRVFYNFDIEKVSVMTDVQLEACRYDEGIIRNRLKIVSARRNALVFLSIQKEHGSFASYLWSFVGGVPIVNNWSRFEDVPITTRESDALSKDLKKRGMNFVGSTIMYAYMQAVGLVDDHLTGCWCRNKQAG